MERNPINPILGLYETTVKENNGSTLSRTLSQTEYEENEERKRFRLEQMMEAVPQEIIDMIIDYLHNDRGTLLVCALTCTAWTPRSYHHLFHSISIGFISNPTLNKFSTLIKLLDNPHCTFAAHVRHLEILGSDHDREYVGRDKLRFSCGWLDPLIPHLPKFRSLTSISWDEAGGPYTFESWRSLLREQQFAEQITDLTLRRPRFRTFNEYRESICAFPSLVRLEFAADGYGDGDLEDDPTCAKPLPTSLRVLTLSTASSYPTLQLNSNQLLLGWLLRSEVVLHTLKLGQIPNVDSAIKFRILASYLQFLGPSLHVLGVEFGSVEDVCA